MATRRRKSCKSRKSRKSCKYGKLKRKSGRRRCRKSKKKRKTKRRRKSKKRNFRMVPSKQRLDFLRMVQTLRLEDLGLLSLESDYKRAVVIDELRRRFTHAQKVEALTSYSFDGFDEAPGMWPSSLYMVKLLLNAGTDVNAKDESGSTALMEATSRGHTDIVQLLKEYGAK